MSKANKGGKDALCLEVAATINNGKTMNTRAVFEKPIKKLYVTAAGAVETYLS